MPQIGVNEEGIGPRAIMALMSPELPPLWQRRQPPAVPEVGLKEEGGRLRAPSDD